MFALLCCCAFLAAETDDELKSAIDVNELRPGVKYVLPRTEAVEVVDDPRGDEPAGHRILDHTLHRTRSSIGVLMGPIKDAHLLLPPKIDPVPPDDDDDDEPAFNPNLQSALLGTQLSNRANVSADKAKWSHRLSMGGSFRQGNTSNTNVNGDYRLERKSLTSYFLARVGGISNQNAGDDPNNRVFNSLLHDQNWRGQWIVYGKDEAEYDSRQQLDLRNVASVGLGYRLIDAIDQRWVMRTGPTLSYVIYANSARQSDELRSGWLIESEYRALVWQAFRLEWTATAFPDFDSEQQLRFRNEAALIFPVGGAFSRWNFKIGARQEKQFDPIAGNRSNDVLGYFAITYMK